MDEFQKKCLSSEPKLESCIVSPKKAHITVLLLCVEDERLDEVRSTFEQICRENFSKDDIFNVKFEGVGRFGNRVLFACPTGNTDKIVSVSETFKSKFSDQDLFQDFKLSPHLTLMKVTRKSHKNIPGSAYEGLEDFCFGTQSFQSIQLLSMTKPETEVTSHQ